MMRTRSNGKWLCRFCGEELPHLTLTLEEQREKYELDLDRAIWEWEQERKQKAARVANVHRRSYFHFIAPPVHEAINTPRKKKQTITKTMKETALADR